MIDRTARILGRRHRLQSADVEDFASEAKLAFIADDYRVVRAFRGKRRFSTYVVSVVRRHFSKWRRKSSQTTSWRPSAAARRLGMIGMEAEELLSRDGLSLEEAFQTLTVSRGWSMSRLEFADVVAQLPVAPRRSFVPLLEGGIPAPSSGEMPKGLCEALEADVSKSLRTALAALDRPARLTLALRFATGWGSSRIGDALGLSRHQEYRLRRRALAQLREDLEQVGLSRESVGALIQGPLNIDLGLEQEARTWELRGTD